MNIATCKLCDSREVDYRAIKFEGEFIHTLSHECFPESDKPGTVIMIRGPSVNHCQVQWNDIMRKRGVLNAHMPPVETTEDILAEWEAENGKGWMEHVRDQAAAGMTTEDVAKEFGLTRSRFKQFCKRKGHHFQWTGKNSPNKCSRRNEKYRKFTAFGVTDTLPKLVEQFGAPHGVTYQMVYRRYFKTKRFSSLETALTTPRTDRVARKKRELEHGV